MFLVQFSPVSTFTNTYEMPTNIGAYLVQSGQPLELRTAPYPTPKEHEIVVRARALAINPCDYACQMIPAMFPWLKLPAVIGEDVAGDVMEVGPGVTDFKVGDRVLGHSLEAFQAYPVIKDHMAASIPKSMSYEDASVIPLGLSTVAMALFPPDFLGLPYPSSKPNQTGKALLIWGASTSVGCNAIQAAVAAGYEVITTASPKNFGLAKKLGASTVFDYNSPTVAEDLVSAFKGKHCTGALAISGISLETRNRVARTCSEIVAKSEGDKFVALTMPGTDGHHPDVGTKFVNAVGLHEERELGYAIFRDWLPQAMAEGKFTAAPAPEVVGVGLGALQGAMDKLKFQGVSAQKLVVRLD